MQDCDAPPVPYAPVQGCQALITPTCVTLGAASMLDRVAAPHGIYPARGFATLTESAPPPRPGAAVERLVGRPRAWLLALLLGLLPPPPSSPGSWRSVRQPSAGTWPS